MQKYYVFTCSNGERWRVPLEIIARHRAEHYKHEFGNSLERSLAEDTMPLFENDGFEISDWARNSMDWSDVKLHAEKIAVGNDLHMQDEWVNPEKIDIEEGE
jgi:hypothetical protein